VQNSCLQRTKCFYPSFWWRYPISLKIPWKRLLSSTLSICILFHIFKTQWLQWFSGSMHNNRMIWNSTINWQTVHRLATFPISPTTQPSFMIGWCVTFHKLMVLTFITFSLKWSFWECCGTGPRILKDLCVKKTREQHIRCNYEMNGTFRKMTHKGRIHRGFTVCCMHIGLLVCCTAFILLSHYYWTHDQHRCYKHGAFSLPIKMLMKCTFLCQLKIQDTVLSL